MPADPFKPAPSVDVAEPDAPTKPADVYPTSNVTPPEATTEPPTASTPPPPPGIQAAMPPATPDSGSGESAAGVRALQEAFAIDIAEREERHRAEVRAMQQSFMTDVAAREDRHRAEVQALHTRFSTEATAREDRHRTELAELQQQLGNVRAQHSEVSAVRDRESEARAGAEIELERLRDEIEVQRTDIARLNAARADLQQQLAASRQETEKWTEQARRAEVELRNARADAEKAAAEAQKQYDEKVAQLVDTTSRLEETTRKLRTSEERAARLADQGQALEAASQQLRQTIAEQRAERERVTGERDQVRQQAMELEAQLRKVEFEAEQADEDASRQLDEAARKLELAEEHSARIAGLVGVHEATIEELRRAAVDAANELRRATVDRDAAKRRVQSLEAEVALLQGEPEAEAAEEKPAETSAADEEAPEAAIEDAPAKVETSYEVDSSSDDRPLALAEDIDLVPWQREALEAWTRAGHRGVVEAVSGAGKTALAHWAIAQAVDEEMKVLVITPTADGVDAWYDGLRAALPINRVGKSNGAKDEHLGSCDVVVATAQDAIRESVFGSSAKVMVVADQVHAYGTREQSRALDPVYSWRLGLSAVYERDDNGIATYLEPYFGRVAFRLGYERALRDEVIAPFDIAVVSVSLNNAEQAEYDALGQQMESLAEELTTVHGVTAEPAHAFATGVVALADGRMGPPRTAARAYQKALAKRDEIVSRASGKASVLKVLAEHVRANEPALVFLANQDDATYVAKVLNTAGCATRALSGATERKLLGRRTDASQDVDDVVLAAGSGSDAASLGIIVGGSRDKLQLIQRVGQVVRRRDDGQPGRVVAIHIEGIDASGDGQPMSAVEPHAASTRRISASDVGELREFLARSESAAEPADESAE